MPTATAADRTRSQPSCVTERAGPVVHRDLDGAVALPDELDDQLVVEVETVALETPAIEAVTAKHLVHRERVSESLERPRGLAGSDVDAVNGELLESPAMSSTPSRLLP